MYNEEQKKKYILYLINDRGDRMASILAEDVFEKTEKIECELGADLSAWPTERAESAFSSPSYSPFPMRFYESLLLVLSYTAWCYSSEGLEINHDLLNIRPKDAQDVQKSMVSGENDLQNKLDQILDGERTDTFDTVLRAFAWISFAGIKTEDMQLIRRMNVDLSIPAIVFREAVHVLPRSALYSVRFAAESDTFVLRRSPSVRLRRAEGNALSRNDIEAVSGREMATVFRNRSKAYEKCGGKSLDKRSVLSFDSVFLSGIYCGIRKEELRGKQTDDALRQHYKNYSEAVNGKRSVKLAAKRSAADQTEEDLSVMTEDYSRWKLAFLPKFQ